MNNNTKARFKSLTKAQRTASARLGENRKSRHAKVAWKQRKQ